MQTQHSLVTSSNGADIAYYHTVVEQHKANMIIALPFGVPSELADAAFAKFHHHYNVVTWQSRYILNTAQAFTGDEPMSADAHVEDMCSVLKALGMKQCILIGYCSGAGIALLAASQHPQIFTRLILVNGEYQLFRHNDSATNYQRSIDAFLPAAGASREQNAFLFARMADISQLGGGAASEFDSQMNLPFSQQEYLYRYAINYLSYRDFDALAIAPLIRQATFIICGAADEHCNMDGSQAIGQQISDSQLFVDDGGDHYQFCRFDSPTLNRISQLLADEHYGGK